MNGPPRHGPAPGGRAVVAGGSLAGMLAAAALAPHAREVVVAERDTLPRDPRPRRGLPQAQHVHLFMSGGVRAMERLLPGVTERLEAAGARRLAAPTDMVVCSPQGWFPRWPRTHEIVLCSRDLLDQVVRRELARHPHVTVLEGTEVLGPAGDAQRVTGVRLRSADAERVLPADLVVDASGRGSRAGAWLTGLGAEAPSETRVDTGLVYASRYYRAPLGAGCFPIVAVQADPRTGTPGRGAVLEPVEGGRWLVTLHGTRGGEPTSDPDAFVEFARSLRDPVVGELIARAEPLSGVAVTRTTVNRRLHFEQLASWPEGFVAVGDAVAAYNPVYGHGMTVAAQGAAALGDTVAEVGLCTPGVARRAQHAVARRAAVAWDLAVGQDVFYPGATGRTPTVRDRFAARFVGRLMYVSTGSGKVAEAVNDVMMLERPPVSLLRPGVLAAVLRGPRLPAPPGPPLTGRELAAARLTPPPGLPAP